MSPTAHTSAAGVTLLRDSVCSGAMNVGSPRAAVAADVARASASTFAMPKSSTFSARRRPTLFCNAT